MKELIAEYHRRKRHIKARLEEFSRYMHENVKWNYDRSLSLIPHDADQNARLFEEMVFCILTANGSAKSGMKAVDYARDVLNDGSVKDIQSRLKHSGVRFHNRAEYIVHNRENLKRDHGFDIAGMLSSFDDAANLRDHLANYIKGFGFKEASHYLRNIGYRGLAILDKHILRTMNDYGIIDALPSSLTRARYLDIENAYHKFSRSLSIDPDELDLLLWSLKNGEILK